MYHIIVWNDILFSKLSNFQMNSTEMYSDDPHVWMCRVMSENVKTTSLFKDSMIEIIGSYRGVTIRNMP